LDNWDYLYALNYLDFERGGITPGIMFRQSKLPLDELDLSFKSFVESVDPTNEEALKGAVGVDNGIGGQIPRGRHRATFCLAMETMLLKPNDAVALVKALGIANQPREWENLPQGSLQKIEEILISYQAADKASANQKLAAPISPEKAISEIDLADEEVETPLKEITLPDQIDFTKVKVPPPTASAPPKKGSAGGSKSKKKIDYKKKTAQSALTGNAGEKFVFSYEKDRLAKFPKLAEKIEWISQKDDSQGYDVISFEENGTPRYIEVKSTTGDANTDFYISRYEIDKANELGSKYKIYRVFNLGTKSPQFFEIELPLESTLELVPETYRARIKPKKP
jgi:hypothetical protein